MRLLARVNHLVEFQRIRVSECLVAHITLIWTLVCVYANQIEMKYVYIFIYVYICVHLRKTILTDDACYV